MDIEKIEIPELKEFAKQAENDNWKVKFKSGILYLSDHSLHADISVFWQKGNESWQLNKKKKGKKNIVPNGELSYPASIFF